MLIYSWPTSRHHVFMFVFFNSLSVCVCICAVSPDELNAPVSVN